MLVRLSDGLQRVSKGWVAASAFVIFLVFTALVLPQQSAMVDLYSGGAGTPDTSIYYTADDLYQMARAYGEVGREAYIRARFTFDVLWPILYTFFLTTSISWLYAKFVSTHRWRYPERTVLVDVLAPIFTLLKWVFIGASFLLLVVGVVLGIWRVLRRR